MDFRNQKITDILLALADAGGTSIIPDDTVTGTASFYFSETDLETALTQFLSTYQLFQRRDGDTIRISRISSEFNPETRLVWLKATDVPVENLIRELSHVIGQTILYDPLPATTISVDIQGLPSDKVMEILTRRLNEYVVETHDSYLYLKHQSPESAASSRKPGEGITRTGDMYTLSIDKARFLELVADLFKQGEREYSLLAKTDTQLDNLYFSGRTFEELLRLILEQGNADFIVHNGIYYILELQRRDVVNKLKKTTMIPLSYISVQDLPGLLPSDLASGGVLKTDKNSNTVLLTGSDEEIGPIVNFISLIDRPIGGMKYERFVIKYLKVKDLLAIVPTNLTPVTPLIIPESNAFIVPGTPEGLNTLRKYISIIDRKEEGYPVQLKYIKTEDLLKSLPPSVSKEDILDSVYPNLFFFTGSEEKRTLFLRELAFIDRPKPQIRYELLVVQYNKSHGLTVGGSTSYKSAVDSSKTAFTGEMSLGVLSLGVDILNQFGYQFASNLSAQLTDGSASVYANTILNGISGQEIKFQNTDTSRYQETEIDPDTKKDTYTGVITEISSGLIITLNGWVSGDNMITVSVNATVSEQDGGSSTSKLPSTSERIVNTQVRTPSGKPIVISGLIKEDQKKTVDKVPVLGSIPLLGLLFRKTVDSIEKTEIVIYIVPHLARDEAELRNTSLRMERYYRTFVMDTLR